jgi:hypothetical protein
MNFSIIENEFGQLLEVLGVDAYMDGKVFKV